MNIDQFRKHEVSRRQFLGSSAKNAAGVAAGMVGLAASASLKAAPSERAPAERVRVATIGVRNQGKTLAAGLASLPDVEVVALCDVDESLRPAAVRAVSDITGRVPRFESDFRRILDDRTIDAVVIATPDHWHAPMTILACEAGKDVYVEKPVSHNVREGEQMVAAARHHSRVVQSGLQQRSGKHFQTAVEFVRSGRLGAVHLAKAWTVHRRKPIGRKRDAAVPEGVNYDLWLGPAPVRAFNANRFHYNWHWFWDYGTGELGNWGCHMLDVARWGLGVDLPERVSAVGGRFHFNDDQETPDTLMVQYAYPEATIIWEHRLWSTHGIEGRSAAAAFYGEAGTLVVDRGGWKVYDLNETIASDTSEQTIAHLRNFIDCVKTRSRPAADIEIGHLSSALCHLGNIAYRVGHEVAFDPTSGTFGADHDANGLLSRAPRSPWNLPTV
ncbi:MAG TPA: Gfo/Idh/MocA family oxidoreductase [Planctomycetaceae bacterium]|jgi:predicted dehydrogenase|nr:Gfo/Idh/MocA family oxidoreductase [Planctomycetaceae bacterium]